MHYGKHQQLYIIKRPNKQFYPNFLCFKFINIPYIIVQIVFCGAEKWFLLFQNKEKQGNIIAQGFLDYIYVKFKEFYNFYNAEYTIYFPNYKFGNILIIVQMDGAVTVLERVTCQILPNSAMLLIQPIRIFHARHGKSLLARLLLAPWRPPLYLISLQQSSSSSSSSPQLSILIWQQSISFSLEAFVRARYRSSLL